MHGRFLILVWAWCLPLMVAVTGTTAEDQQGEGCSAKRCGNITISDPFWLPDEETGRSCGLPGASDFQLRCLNSSYPVLRSSVPYSPGFKIINISVGERSLRVVDLGKLQLFHTSKSCLPFWNTSVKLGRPFRIDPVSHNLILYNCTEEAAARRGTELVKTVMRCANATNTFVRTEVPYDPTGNYASYALEGCDAIVVPVLAGSPSGKTNADNYERLIDDGFLLTWDLDPLPPRSKKKEHKILLIGMTSAAATFLLACLLCADMV